MAENKALIQFADHLNREGKDQPKVKPAGQDSMSSYDELIEELPDGYAELDLEGNLVRFNKALVAMYSRTAEELKNLSYKEFLDPQTIAKIRQENQNVCRTGQTNRFQVYEINCKDGQKKVVEGSITIKKVNGKVAGFRGFWRDVTERKRAEQALAEQQSRLEAIFTSVKEAIVALDASGRMINANRAVETICGVALDALTGQPFAQTLALCSRSCQRVVQEALCGKTAIKEQQIQCNRHTRPYQVVVFNTSPLMAPDGRSMGALLVIRDITELQGLEKELRGRYKFQNIIGKSKKMQEIYDLLENLANLETTVLITGESGTGKELLAKALHYAGGRSHKPFVRVNCSALSENLLESELFGHVKGAFTGAVKDRQGRFQTADGGTLLLDEIGDISPLIQLKLLRVLQEKEFERVGESAPHKVDVRVIASTNKDLRARVKNGEYREDLYYRLKVMEITLPALRDRIEDIPLLVDHFCRILRERYNKGIQGVSSAVLSQFMNYAWPGNIRELEHGLEHAFVLCNGPAIELEHLPVEIRDHVSMAPAACHPKLHKKGFAAQDTLQVLEKCRWNKTKAALLLGIDRKTLHRKIKQFHLLEE
jgi:PAS domain S-box-containing protein